MRSPLPSRTFKLRIGDILYMKKEHPCGSRKWRVWKLGLDVGIECLGCGRKVKVRREKLERKIKRVISPPDVNRTPLSTSPASHPDPL